MPKQKRYKTDYVGVYYIIGSKGWKVDGKRKPEKIYYIVYRKNGKRVEERAGRQFQDDMTPARASLLRAERIKGEASNKERREADASRWTIDRLWKDYSTQFPDRKSVGTDVSRYDLHIEPALGDRVPEDLFPLDIERFKKNLLMKKSPTTVVNILSLLKRIINYGINNHDMSGLSFKVKMPKVTSQPTETLTKEQLTNLMKVLESTKLVQVAAMMKMALFTGMRRGEIYKLKWEDIDFDGGFIHIRNPKGGKDAIIPLNEPARQLLEGIEQGESLYVFPGKDGGPRKDAHKQMNIIKEAAKLPKEFRAMHGLRHAYASMLASSGIDLYTVGKLLTHKSINMTARYAHLSDGALRDASNVAGEIVSNALKTENEDKAVNEKGRDG